MLSSGLTKLIDDSDDDDDADQDDDEILLEENNINNCDMNRGYIESIEQTQNHGNQG